MGKPLRPDEREDHLERALIDYLKATGWLVHKDRAVNLPGAHVNEPGYPDITAVHRGTGAVVFIECKSAIGKLSPEQEVWREALLADDDGTHNYAVVRPADWDQIIAALDRLRQAASDTQAPLTRG